MTPAKAAAREKLDLIDELFPPERLVRSQERWTRLWRGEPPLDRYPFVYAPFQYGCYCAGFTPQECLHANLDEIIGRGQLHDDYIPAFFPGCRQGTIPSMFGAEEIVLNGDYSCHRLLDRLEDVDCLPEPSLGPGTIAHEWLTMEDYALQETEGRLPVHPTDMQGPADVCGQLLGYETFLAAAYEDPARFHDLISRVTDAFILFWDAQRRLCGDRFVATHLFGWDWVPPGPGVSISADSLAMVSPAYFQEFYQPYLERISAAFGGGMAVHSCGDFSATIPALCATPSLRAVNAGEMTIPALVQAGVDASTLIIGFGSADQLPELFELIREHRLRLDMTIFGAWPMTAQGVKPLADWTGADRSAMQHFEDRIVELATV